ncbi:UNVERIFIED_CONTAM: hypothetical protein PYX00_000923 [Menopon gallinae]
MKDMCAECGADLRKDEQITVNASVPMVHSIPELKVSEEQAQIIGKADENRLLADRKLVLLVDLDQTLIHTTNDNIPPNLKDVYHFRLYGPISPWHHTRIRPRTHEFLEEISKYYELHICTFGARNYAHTIAMFLDPDGKFFSHRILSRDECFNANSKTANLKALFPCGDSMVCIIDDREDVWNFAANLIHVKPYHFFRHTGDINAPPGLTKKENDEIDGFDFTNMDKIPRDNEPSKVPEEDKQQKRISPVRDKVEILGESTTDKDTEDEAEEKSAKKVKDELFDKIVGDLQLSEDDSGDTVIEQSGDSEQKKKDTSESEEGKEAKPEEETKVEEKEPETKVEECSERTNEVDPVPEVKNEEKPSTEEPKSKDAEDLIEVVDPDDYLTHLEDILKCIHKAYYEEYDVLKDKDSGIPDLKVIIPKVKQTVLQGCNLVFSGMIPSHKQLQQSRAYMVAVSLGATVSQDVSASCTHLVAARPGTAKVISSRRYKGIHLVTPLWLWHCAERWKRVDEKLYPLGRGVVMHRHPPAHCGSPERNICEETDQYAPALRNRTPSGRFIDTINPLLTFSSEDRKIMDQEVDDLCRDEDDDDDETESELDKKKITKKKPPSDAEDSSTTSSEDSLSGKAHPKGWDMEKEKSRKRKADTTTCTDSEYDEESPSVKFRRGEPLPSDLDFGDDSQDSPASDEPLDDVDDRDWNMMGAALEREFLSGD